MDSIKNFDALIDGYLLNTIGISERFLSDELSKNLSSTLLELYKEDKLKTAKTGNDNATNLNVLIRNDKIFWLDKIHNNASENAFLQLIDRFVLHLNSTCYTGITSYEFHFAMYEEGSFYKKHFDQFKSNASRQYTMIFYLNPDWKIADGGELCVYFKDETTQKIAPTNGKSIFFKSSELEHEVMLSNAKRMSITGWLKIDKELI
jgi:SM-20-related protein